MVKKTVGRHKKNLEESRGKIDEYGERKGIVLSMQRWKAHFQKLNFENEEWEGDWSNLCCY